MNNSTPQWRIKSPSSEDSLTKSMATAIAKRIQVSTLLVHLMNLRGLSTPEEMERFLNPGLRHLHPLERWPNIERGAKLIRESIERNEKIAIWGDYDVDGITATSLVKDFLNKRRVDVSHYIPDRMEFGYGLHPDGIHRLATQGIKLLISVDCGIANIEEVQIANNLGMNVIITDHHLPGPTLPNAAVIINPKLDNWPSTNLAGVGVIFLLMGALNRILPDTLIDIREYLDLVALGTIADVVPLDDQNRILVKNGLLLISEGRRTGIQALKSVSKIGQDDKIDAGTIGFSLAPRINAAGRIGNPNLAVNLLLEEDYVTAEQIANKLDKLNSKRKNEESRILEEATAQAEGQLELPAFVLHSEHWHSGIIGIVASRIVEKYNRPCLILTKENGLFKGSGRSTPNVNLYLALEDCKQCLYKFGGHQQAAGLKLAPFQLANLKIDFPKAVTKQIGNKLHQHIIEVDTRLSFSEITPSLLKELDMLQPFGPNNPKPIFISPPSKVLKIRFFSHNQHIELYLQDTNDLSTARAIAWRQGNFWLNKTLQEKVISIAYFPNRSKYNGLTQIELTVNHIFIHSDDTAIQS